MCIRDSSRRFFEKHYLPLLPFGLVASQVYAVQSAFLGYVESVIASLNFRETEFDEFIELVSFYVINRLRHYREEPVADVTPQWLKNTVEAMHDKLKFGEGALENMVRLSGKTQEYLTRATQRYYGKTPMQIINDIRLSLIHISAASCAPCSSTRSGAKRAMAICCRNHASYLWPPFASASMRRWSPRCAG